MTGEYSQKYLMCIEYMGDIRDPRTLKILEVTLQDNPCNLNLHFQEMFKKAKVPQIDLPRAVCIRVINKQLIVI